MTIKSIEMSGKKLDGSTNLARILRLRKRDIETAPLNNPEMPLKIIRLIEKDTGTELKKVVTTLGVIKPPKTNGVLALRRAKRGGTYHHGLWTLPGGRLKTDLSPEDEFVRETKEETNLDAIVTRELGTFYEVEVGMQHVRVIHAFEARVDSFSDLKLSAEHDAWNFYFSKYEAEFPFDGVCKKVLCTSERK